MMNQKMDKVLKVLDSKSTLDQLETLKSSMEDAVAAELKLMDSRSKSTSGELMNKLEELKKDIDSS
jgi:hypothetical protein